MFEERFKRKKIVKKVPIGQELVFNVITFLKFQDILNFALTSKDVYDLVSDFAKMKSPEVIHDPWTIAKALYTTTFRVNIEEDILLLAKKVHTVQNLEISEILPGFWEIINKKITNSKFGINLKMRNFTNQGVVQTLESIEPKYSSLIKRLSLNIKIDESLKDLSHFPNIEYLEVNCIDSGPFKPFGKYPAFEMLKELVFYSKQQKDSFELFKRIMDLSPNIENLKLNFERKIPVDFLKIFSNLKNLKVFQCSFQQRRNNIKEAKFNETVADFLNLHQKLKKMYITTNEFSFFSRMKEHKNLKKMTILNVSAEVSKDTILEGKLWKLNYLCLSCVPTMEPKFWDSINKNCPLLVTLIVLFDKSGSSHLQDMIVNNQFENLWFLSISDLSEFERIKILSARPKIYISTDKENCQNK